MADLPQLIQQAAVLCGAGSGAALRDMAHTQPDPRVWAMAVHWMDAKVHSDHPPFSRLNYFRSVLRSCARELALCADVPVSQPEPRRYLAGPYGHLVRS